MPTDIRYRYFLGSRPDPGLLCALAPLCEVAGQRRRHIRAEHLHLTWFVIAELHERDPFILGRVEGALAAGALTSGSMWLGRVRGGAKGATLYSRGHKPEILRLYGDLASRLTARGLPPLHRKSGFDPHLTLGYDPCAFDPFLVLHEWIPDALLLIESEVGKTIHNVLGRWPLLAPRQGVLPLEPRPAPLMRAEAGRR